MKKIFTLLCAVVVALSASAVPALKGQKKGLKGGFELPKIENVKYQRVAAPLFKDSKIAKAPAAKKDVATPSDAQASFFGNYNDYVYETVGDLTWELSFFGGDSLDFIGSVEFSATEANKINGEYEATGYAVFAPGDTADITAALRLTAVDFNDNYLVELAATDELGRAWNFNDTINIFALDYLYYMYYMYGLIDDISMVLINLDDYEIAPTGETDTLRIAAGRVNNQIETYGWWVFAGYTADDVFVQFSNAGTTDHIIGTYAFADLDPEYSFIEIDGVTYYFSDANIEISQAEDGTHHAVGSAMGKNGIEYVIFLDEEYITPSANVITINYNTNSRALTFVPSVEGEYYFFYIVDKASLDEMVSEYSQDSLAPIVSSLVSYMIQQEVIGYYIDTTAISVSVPDFFGEYAETGNYVALAAPINDYGDVNGQIAYFEFHFDFPEGIEDAKAEEKAIKKFENGQLIIEKNGVKYNAQGAILK